MRAYKLIAPSFVVVVTIDDSDLIESSDSRIDWAVGRPWKWLRDYCEGKGWTIQPLLDSDNEITELEYDGATYEFHWKNGRCFRITRHLDGEAEDITSSDLPDEIQVFIE